MTHRLPLVVAVTALVVALLGSTSLGEAAGDLAGGIVPRAKRADYARNAGAVNGIKASRTPRPGFLVPLGRDGKLPASAVAGNVAAGKGLKTVKVRLATVNGTTANSVAATIAYCETGERATGGGVIVSNVSQAEYRIVYSRPIPNGPGNIPNGWQGGIFATATDADAITYAYVLCAGP
jgi:hypothetical protein